MAALARIQACVGELKWMTHHRLQLNDNKTEVLVITTPSSASKHSLTDVVIGDSILQPTAVARNIGVMFDSELSMKSQVSKLCKEAYFHLHRIRSIRDCLTQHALNSWFTPLSYRDWTMEMASFMVYLVSYWTSCRESRMWQLALWSEPVAMTTSHPS